MNIVRIWFSPQYQCMTEKSLSEQSVTIGAKNVGISYHFNNSLNHHTIDGRLSKYHRLKKIHFLF